jgi:hypothetical protein
MGNPDSEGVSKHKGYAMTKKTSVSFWNIIRENRTTFLVGALIPSVFGLFLAETVMAVQFNALQPILGGMTFLTVEVLGAWLVDFPLSVVAGCIITKKMGASEAKYGALAGAVFLTIFLILVACIGGGLHQFATSFDVFGLGDAVLLAAQTARQQLGFHLGVIMFMFMVSDYFLCMLGGILGFHLVRLIYPSETQES